MTTLNKQAFDELINGNILWLNQFPDTLEKQHIILTLKDYSKKFYDCKILKDGEVSAKKAKIDAVINKIMAKVNNAETQIELIKMLEELKNENFI